ncbi:thioesterase domain-containing protein, putative [Marinospirillum celere]|uniref:Thioesterase domain-containing protein, putative n=1 Tax=Marinospirillum celere TaxID=1122252 RepID=A0A1I1DUC1_9GAMM|nr:YiiD C-terminal domain-containing protein [Marinospirillum celere]SFB78022.1 thioesterase domain-containing protein, putative [Marinospirillum celere]
MDLMQQIDSNFLPWLKTAIPLTDHMGIKSLQWQEKALVAELELASLVNDKGTGFGGGVAGLATLLGWCYVTLLLDATSQRCPVVVKESSNRFTAPLTEDFEMLCWCEEEGQPQRFLESYAEKGRSSIQLHIEARQQGRIAFTYQGTYVALGKS